MCRVVFRSFSSEQRDSVKRYSLNRLDAELYPVWCGTTDQLLNHTLHCDLAIVTTEIQYHQNCDKTDTSIFTAVKWLWCCCFCSPYNSRFTNCTHVQCFKAGAEDQNDLFSIKYKTSLRDCDLSSKLRCGFTETMIQPLNLKVRYVVSFLNHMDIFDCCVWSPPFCKHRDKSLAS